MSLLPSKSECLRRCVCKDKYVRSVKSGVSTRTSAKKKRVKFPRPLQLSIAERAKLRAAQKEAELKAKLGPKEKLPFPEAKPLRPKLSGFAALQRAADKEAKKKAAQKAKENSILAQLNLPPGTKLPPGSRILNGVLVDKDGKPIDLNKLTKGKWKGGKDSAGKDAAGKGGKKKGKGKRKKTKDHKPRKRLRPPCWQPKRKKKVYVLERPPLRFKKWIPPYLLPWPPRPKIQVDIPPFNRRKWIPPYLRKRRAKDLAKVDYPPLSLRKWIPPYLRKRPKREKLISLHGKNFRIDPSTLNKYWRQFRFIDDWYGIVSGEYSQTYKKYNYRTNGFQAPCNVMVAMTISKLYQMKFWHKKFLNGILDIGNNLYLESLKHLPPNVNPNIKVEDVYRTFYFGRTKITMTLDENTFTGKVFKDYEDELYLRNVIKCFFKKHYSGILIIKKRYRAVWKQSGKYFMFDPTEHDELGHKWEGQPGYGHCYVVMFLTTEKLIDFIHESIEDTTINYKFTLVPCDILRTIDVVTDYPDCLLEFEEEEKKPVSKKDLDRSLRPPPPEPVEEPVEEDPQWIELDEVAPDAIPEGAPERKTKIKEPFEKPKADIITYFTELELGRIGILRANTYQSDPKFSKYKGQQTLANAVAALTMLRLYKSKQWTSVILDNVLKTGEVVYHDSKRNKKFKQEPLRIEHITNKVTIEEKDFTPVFEELVIMGKLQSTSDALLDLLPAIREFFTDNGTGILCGPLTLAVWYEDGLFYMFDPEERDANGYIIIRTVEIGSEIVFKDIPPGRACVTWYSQLDDLVEKYMKNIDKYHRRDYFSFCKVEIKDYITTYDDWNNFKALKENKWILRGRFSQSSKRFEKETRNTQCTAMAALALAYTKVIPIKEWSTDTIDEIITEGDAYYAKCVETLKEKGNFVSNKLLVEELLRILQLKDKEITFEIDDCVVNGIVSLKEEPIAKNLVQGLIEFFEDNDNGILTAKSLSLAIWKFKDIYYLFDSHSRNEKGFVSNYGNACVLRFINITDMSSMIEANFGVEENCFYNISRVEPSILDIVGDGVVVPPLNNYTQIDDVMAILRSNLSDVSEEFGFNRGKQVTANCFVAAGMNSLYPPLEWSPTTLDKILKRGDKLYEEAKEAIYKEMLSYAKDLAVKPPPTKKDEKPDSPTKGRRGGGFPLVLTSDLRPEKTLSRLSKNLSTFSKMFYAKRAGGFPITDADPLAVDLKEDMNSENVLTMFKIGVNNIELEFTVLKQNTIETDMEDTLINYLGEPPADGESQKKELLLETDHVTYYIFKDNNVYYLFTSQPCDHEGCFFGREEWTVPPPPEPEVEPYEDDFHLTEGEEEEEEETQPILMPEEPDDNFFFDLPMLEEEQPVMLKHSSHYWRSIAEKDGRAFVAWFTKPEYLAEHVLLNFPEEMKTEKYSLKKILVKSNAEIKEYYDPKQAERTDPYDGDYYDFKEIERGRWILRGTYDQCWETFPLNNRGNQTIANCFTAIGFFQLYSIMTFKTITVDSILKYGDRLLSFTKNLRRKSLRETKELKLTESQIDEVLQGETYGISDIFRVFSIGDEQVTLEINEYELTGEINAEENDTILNVNKALTNFFAENKYGILCAKDLCVAVIKGGNKMFYMFDPQSRGPSGIKCVNGVACITRFLELDQLVNLFLLNLEKEGKNAFVIHKIIATSKRVPPPPPPPPVDQPPDPSLVGYSIVVPGKRIIRGTISQEDPKYGRGKNIQSATMSLVALAMSFIHRCSNWTKPIIDEIVDIGDEVYAKALDKLGFSFNPWEETMTLERVPPDFIIGELKINCELRDTTQTGIFNIKDPKILNIRQGIERFFEENTHGVIESDVLTLAIWEDDYEKLIYIFDPYPRGPTGMPLAVNGTACAIGCRDAKMVADHIISLLEDNAQMPYVLIPVELVIGKNKKKCKRIIRTVRKTESALERQRKAMELRKRKHDMRLEQLGRKCFYKIPGAEIATLRGTKSQNDKQYSANSRNNQDIPICLTAFVMERLLPLIKWTSNTIDQILDVGDQLYKDCFVVNVPIDPKIGLEYVLRQVIIKDVKVHVAICKPVIINQFTYDNLLKGLTIYFMQKQFCLLNINNEWTAIFLRDDEYYLFDPHERNILGEVFDGGKAVLIKYPNIDILTRQLWENYRNGEETTYQVVLLGIKGIEKYEMTPCRCGVDTENFFRKC